jgi:VWFA-related protein
MKLKGGACCVAVCFAPALFIITLFAQSKEAFQSQKVPQHDAAAIIKLVTVRVLDQEGRPVTDLKKDDFVLYDNGKKKIITEFEVHTLSEEGMKVLPSGEAADLARSVEGMNRRLFIFLDIQGSDVNGMANAKQAALHFVDTQLRPGDEVGILGFSPLRGFLIQEYLTTDHERIRRAIEKTKDIEVKPSPGFISGGELDDSVRDRSEHSGTMRSGKGSGAAVSVSGRTDVIGSERASIGVPGSSAFYRRDFVPRMFDLTQAMKYIRGNKSLIIFTARNLGPNASRLGKEFASASTPVYTVNTRNWIRQGVFTSIKKKHIWTEHPLQDLARESGGKYFADIKDMDTISREIQSLTGNFYVLGYYIDETWDGTYHQIKVEVAKPGLQVLAQHGYFNPRPYAELSDFQKQLHLFDLVFTDKNISAELLEIPIEPLFIFGEEGANCVLLSQIMVDEKTGVPPSKVEIYALLFDEDHKVVKERNGDVDFSSFAGEILLPYFLADLPSGKYECRLVTRDTETGQACVGKVTFGIPDMSEAEIVLSSPLLFAAGPESKIFKLSRKKGQKEKDEDLSLDTIYRYLPENHSLVVREIRPEIENLLAVLPITFSGGPAPEVEFKARLHPKPEGEAVLLPMEILDAKPISDNKDILMMEMSLPDLLPGEYDLEIEAIVKNTSASCSVHRSLVRR